MEQDHYFITKYPGHCFNYNKFLQIMVILPSIFTGHIERVK